MDVKYIGGDEPWTLPFGDHFNSTSSTFHTSSTSPSELESIARRHGFEPLYSVNEKRSEPKFPFPNNHLQWMNTGILFTDKTIEPGVTGAHHTDFSDNHGHTFCYLCSINQHHHDRTHPRDHARRRKLIPYNNPKAPKVRSATTNRPVSGSSTGNSTSYRFIVRTGTREKSGTRAQVFLYMYGTECDWTSINLRARANQTSDGFPTGSTRTFCLKGPDIGQLHHLNVNLVGARSNKEWFLKEIEITNLNTSVTWLCEFNCWLPKNDGKDRHEVKPIVNPQVELSPEDVSVYILQVRTGGKPFAGTDSTIHIMVRGSRSQTRRIVLTSDAANLFEQNQLDTFAIVGWDLGDLLELTVDSDRKQLAADWDLKEMSIWKILPNESHQQVQVYFPFNKWLGKQASTLKAEKEAYAATDHHPRGPTCYHIAIKTGDKRGAGTDANVFIIIYGESGRTCLHHLDNPGKNDFESKSTSVFTIMDIDVGSIKRIKIWHDNSNPGAGWFLDFVIIRKKHSTCRPITNVFIQRLSHISKALYDQAVKQVKKTKRAQSSSPKDEDHHSADRSLSRKSSAQKKVTWDEDSIGPQDQRFHNDTQRTKNKQAIIDHKQPRDSSPVLVESGHFEHRAYWISSHAYRADKWQIQSAEEKKTFNLEESVRSLLSSDRSAIGSKIKTSINDRDDDVYEFEANRWLAIDEADKKLEVYLEPKTTRLSTHTRDEAKAKAKSSSDATADFKKKPSSSSTKSSSSHTHHDDLYSKRSSPTDLGPLQRSPRSLTPLDRPSYESSKTPVEASRESQRSTGASRQLRESSIGSFDRHLSSSQHASSPRDRTAPSDGDRQPTTRTPSQPSPRPPSAVPSMIDRLPMDSPDQRSKSQRDSVGRSVLSGSQRELVAKLTDPTPPSSARSIAKSTIDPHSSDWHSQRTKSPRDNLERTSPMGSREEQLAKLKGPPSHPSRSGTTSLIDTRSSYSYHQRSESSRLNKDTSSPLPSNRDSPVRKAPESPFGSKTTLQSPAESSTHRPTRSQVYGSAYSTLPTDDY